MSTPLADAPSRLPTTRCHCRLPGPAGTLEILSDGPPPAQRRPATAVICHPHPLHGGSMHNKVVTTLARSLQELGLATVCFNFRGVGGSTGQYDDGVGEGDDLAAVVAWVRAVAPGDALWLAGFSFGSFVSIANAQALSAEALISIAPPVGRWSFAAISPPSCPWLIVQGEADEVVDPAAVYAWQARLKPAPTLVRMPAATHFFHRRLLDLRAVVQEHATSWLPARHS